MVAASLTKGLRPDACAQVTQLPKRAMASAAVALTAPRPHGHDDRSLIVDLDRLDHRLRDAQQHRPYSDRTHAVRLLRVQPSSSRNRTGVRVRLFFSPPSRYPQKRHKSHKTTALAISQCNQTAGIAAPPTANGCNPPEPPCA